MTQHARKTQSPDPGLDALNLDESTLDGLRDLRDKLEPLIAGGRLTRIVDLLSVTADLVDMTDDAMIEKLMKAAEDVAGGAWTAGNAARMAGEQVRAMTEAPGLVALARQARQPEVRRGLAFVLAFAGVMGRQLEPLQLGPADTD